MQSEQNNGTPVQFAVALSASTKRFKITTTSVAPGTERNPSIDTAASAIADLFVSCVTENTSQ